MPLTPQDIVRKEFREALRGYNQADVDLFLDEVVEEFTRLTEENQKMKVRLAALQQEVARVRESRGGTAPVFIAGGGAEADRQELEVRARVRRFLEDQLRLLESSGPSAAVEQIVRTAPPPPPARPASRQPSSPPRREPPESQPLRQEPPSAAEPFWAGE